MKVEIIISSMISLFNDDDDDDDKVNSFSKHYWINLLTVHFNTFQQHLDTKEDKLFMNNEKWTTKTKKPTKTAAMVTVTLRDIIMGRTTPMAQEIPFMRKRAAREAMRISHLLWVIDIMAEMKKVLSINSILTIIIVLWTKPSIHPCPSRFFELYILI